MQNFEWWFWVVLQFFKRSMARYESDLTSVVHSLILSISENDLNFDKSGQCSSSCLKFALVKLLRLSGYDAAVCAARWQGSSKVPGGMPFISILQKPYFVEFLGGSFLSCSFVGCVKHILFISVIFVN